MVILSILYNRVDKGSPPLLTYKPDERVPVGNCAGRRILNGKLQVIRTQHVALGNEETRGVG